MNLVTNTYSRYYRGIDACGEGVLRPSDIEYFKREDFVKDKEPVSLIISGGITEVEAGFFDIFLTLAEVIVPDSVRRISLSDESRRLFRKNKVVLRGPFDSYADRFAKEKGFSYLHSDIELARHGDYYERGVDIITLRFRPDGSPFIHQDCRCQGSSAGSVGGGEVSFDLPKGFYKKQTPEDIANQVWGSCYGQVRDSKALKTFLEKAKERKGYYDVR